MSDDLDDLEDMFANDLKPEPVPKLQQTNDFASGAAFRQEPPPSTDIALVAVFINYVCACCHSTTLAPAGWAVKRKHHSRNAVIELQFVMDSALPLYRGLPKVHSIREQEAPFCRNCYIGRGYEDLD